MLYVLLAIVCLFSPYAMGMERKDMQKISTYQCAKPFVNTLVAYSTSIEGLNKGAYEMNPDSSVKYGYVGKFVAQGKQGGIRDSRSYPLIRLSKKDAKSEIYWMTTKKMTSDSLYMRRVTAGEEDMMRQAIQRGQAKFTGPGTFWDWEGIKLLQKK